MKIEISGEKENKLMKRREVEVSIQHDGASSPSKAALQITVAKHMNIEPNKVDIHQIFTRTGSPNSRAIVRIWHDKTVDVLSEKKKEGAAEEGSQ